MQRWSCTSLGCIDIRRTAKPNYRVMDSALPVPNSAGRRESTDVQSNSYLPAVWNAPRTCAVARVYTRRLHRRSNPRLKTTHAMTLTLTVIGCSAQLVCSWYRFPDLATNVSSTDCEWQLLNRRQHLADGYHCLIGGAARPLTIEFRQTVSPGSFRLVPEHSILFCDMTVNRSPKGLCPGLAAQQAAVPRSETHCDWRCMRHL